MNLKAKIVGTGFAFALLFVAGWEGLRTTGYLDTGDVPTICFGDTGPGVRVGQVVTPEGCRARLNAKMRHAWDVVDRLVTVPLKPWEHAAFASFVYNVGEAAFARSRLLRWLNDGQTLAACTELLRWVYDDGRKIRGLERRRASEHQLCIGAMAN